jgi:GT2 family glycosyltransferase
MTSGNIVNLDAYEKVGGWKDWMFIDCVDTDFCMNLHKHGYKVLRLNKVIMEHHLGDRTFPKLFGKVPVLAIAMIGNLMNVIRAALRIGFRMIISDW